MRFKIVSLCCLLLLCLSVAQLVAQPAETPFSPEESALQRALDHYSAGKLNEAGGLLRGFAVSYPDSDLVDQAYYYLARVHQDLNDPATALEYLGKISAGAQSPAGILLKNQLLLQQGEENIVVDELLPLQTGQWPFPEQQERYLLLAEAFLALEEPQRALFFNQRALITEGAETPRDVLNRIYTLLSNHYHEQDLAEAAFMYQGSPVSYLAMLQLGWRALAAGQKDLAQKWATAALTAPVGFAYHEEALALQSQLSDPTQLQRAIGVLLPLSGRYAAFGQRVQRGIEMAIETFPPRIPVRFIFRDTAGDETLAAQQTAQLAISDQVMGIAGPLVGNAASGASRRANQERVPLLAMSQKEGLAASSLYVFRNSLTPQLQVRALVDYAMETMEFTTFGIMNPQNRQGERFAELFQEEVLQRGGEIIAVQSYQTDQTDFRYQVRLLQGLDPNAPDEEEEECDPEDQECLEKEDEPPPFEALFVPDYADRISLVAPQLAFYGLEGVQLLGTNGWNDADLPRLARQFVEGAVFTDGYFKNSSYPFVQEFSTSYFERYGEEPTILEAQGYDVAGILLTLLNDSRVQTRDDLRRALAQMQNYPGVTGATHFNFIGEAEKVLYLLQVQNGTIVQLN